MKKNINLLVLTSSVLLSSAVLADDAVVKKDSEDLGKKRNNRFPLNMFLFQRLSVMRERNIGLGVNAGYKCFVLLAW